MLWAVAGGLSSPRTRQLLWDCPPGLSDMVGLSSPLPTGNYEVSIKFNDEHIPESPYVVPVIAPSDDARRLTVLSLQVRRKETSISLATA